MVVSRAEPRFRQIVEAVEHALRRRGFTPDAAQVDRTINDELGAVALTGGLSPALALNYAPDDIVDDVLDRLAPTGQVSDWRSGDVVAQHRLRFQAIGALVAILVVILQIAGESPLWVVLSAVGLAVGVSVLLFITWRRDRA